MKRMEAWRAPRAVAVLIALLGALACPKAGSGSVTGRVQTISGGAVPGAHVTIGGRTTATLGSGYFEVKDLRAGPHVLSVKAPGFASTTKAIRIITGEIGYAQVMLVKTQTVRIANLSKSNRIRKRGIDLMLPADAIVGQDGVLARSAVLRFATIDVRREGLYAMPGSFRGTSAGGRVEDIETFGAISLELESPDGKPLQVRKGRPLTLRLPVQGRAPGEQIALWSLDERTGLWKQEGFARIARGRRGAVAGAQLPHLSWWNIDQPISNKTCIWVKAFLNPQGESLFTPTLLVRGIDYNGLSASYYQDVDKQGPGQCVDAKPDSEVALQASFYDDTALYTMNRRMRTGKPGVSCAVDPNKCMIIESVVLQRAPETCIRGRIQLRGNSPGRGLVVRLFDSRAQRRLLFGADVDNNGEFCMDRIPIARRAWLYVTEGRNRDSVSSWKWPTAELSAEPASFDPVSSEDAFKKSRCRRFTRVATFPVRAPDSGAVSCQTKRSACFDVGTLRGVMGRRCLF